MVLVAISRNIWTTPDEGATARINIGARQQSADGGILLARGGDPPSNARKGRLAEFP